MRARSALFTLFGDVIRPAGGEAWLRTITASMDTVGIRAPAVRTALHRMSGEGWVRPRREGRYAAYRLTDRGVARLEEAAARIYRLRSAPWDGRWRVVVADLTNAGEVRRELEWVGYGQLRPGVWVSPHDHATAARSLLGGVGIGAVIVTGTLEESDEVVASAAWDLEDLAARYRDFDERWSTEPSPEDEEAAFRQRLLMVHDWRSFLFVDPGLPAELLPPDWSGHAAAETFRDRYERISEPAWRWYAARQSDAAPRGVAPPAETVRPSDSPFARGLDALRGTSRPEPIA